MLKQKLKISNIILTVLALSFLLSASSSYRATAAGTTQNAVISYNSSTTIDPGMIVGIKSKDVVSPLSLSSINSMIGVVITPNQSALALSPATTTSDQVFVASSGHYNVLVSSQGGSIKVGDPISISSINGIGMEANQNEALIVGRALAPFNSKSTTVGSAKISEAIGSTTVSIGLIPVNVDVAHNPIQSKQISYVPGDFAKAATAISDKPVSAARVYLSLLILIIAFVLSITLFYSGVRSAIVSIGRNPLSKKSIIKGLIQTVITGLLVFAAGISGVYLILKL